MKSAMAWTSNVKKLAPITCIVAAQSSQKGTRSSAHADEQRAGKPVLQSSLAEAPIIEPQQIGVMPSMSRSMPRLHAADWWRTVAPRSMRRVAAWVWRRGEVGAVAMAMPDVEVTKMVQMRCRRCQRALVPVRSPCCWGSTKSTKAQTEAPAGI